MEAALRIRLAFKDAEAALGGSLAQQAHCDGAAARRTLAAFQVRVSEVLESTGPAAVKTRGKPEES